MNAKSVDILKSLVQLDIDAVGAYSQAIEHIENTHISENLNKFMRDHQQHIDNLSNILRVNGEEAPEMSRDFKGFFIEGFTSLRSVTGDEGALKAMRTNEQLTNKKYKEAVDELSLDTDIIATVESNYRDEQEHLSYIEGALEARIWEKTGTHY
jgi:rubrerythrin